MWEILYNIFLEFESNKKNNLESSSISTLEKEYWIRNETIWKYVPDRIKRKSLETNEKCIKLYQTDIKNIKKVIELYESIGSLRIDEVNIIKFITMHLLSIT
jgi:hypothetical protein